MPANSVTVSRGVKMQITKYYVKFTEVNDKFILMDFSLPTDKDGIIFQKGKTLYMQANGNTLVYEMSGLIPWIEAAFIEYVFNDYVKSLFDNKNEVQIIFDKNNIIIGIKVPDMNISKHIYCHIDKAIFYDGKIYQRLSDGSLKVLMIDMECSEDYVNTTLKSLNEINKLFNKHGRTSIFAHYKEMEERLNHMHRCGF